jgi:hypothetical protein
LVGALGVHETKTAVIAPPAVATPASVTELTRKYQVVPFASPTQSYEVTFAPTVVSVVHPAVKLDELYSIR